MILRFSERSTTKTQKVEVLMFCLRVEDFILYSSNIKIFFHNKISSIIIKLSDGFTKVGEELPTVFVEIRHQLSSFLI